MAWVIDIKSKIARADAPGIRAVAGIFKQAEEVGEILRTYALDTTPWGNRWTVSMENISWLNNSGFLIAGTKGCESFAAATPADLAGYTYVPCVAAPLELLRCLNNAQDDAVDGMTSRRVQRAFQDQETILLLGGLDGTVFYNGVGLTPGGPMEAEARVSQMIAGGRLLEVNGALLPDFFAPLRALLAAAGTVTRGK